MQWLEHKLPVPRFWLTTKPQKKNYLLMTAVPGQAADAYTAQHDPYAWSTAWSKACANSGGADSKLSVLNDRASRVRELEDLMRRGLADIATENWR